jgi:hypothetical protein
MVLAAALGRRCENGVAAAPMPLGFRPVNLRTKGTASATEVRLLQGRFYSGRSMETRTSGAKSLRKN